jgi:uncharacterized protein YceK
MMAFATLAICLGGCGTFADAMCGPIDDHYFYRGVRLDVMAPLENPINLPLLADIPFSAAADTLLLPLATTAYIVSLARKAEPPDLEKPGKPVETQEAVPGSRDGSDSLQK